MPSNKIVIVGGHGQVGLKLARKFVARPGAEVVSLVRNESQKEAVEATGAKPVVACLENDTVAKFAEVFTGASFVYFVAGAKDKASAETARKIDYDGGLKVFDAIESLQGDKPRLVLLSCCDVRDPDTIPEHYDDQDKAVSASIREAYPNLLPSKLARDKDLVKRTSFKWTIVRSGGLYDEMPIVGKFTVGRGHIASMIHREDVIEALVLLADKPGAAGLAIDLTPGTSELGPAFDEAIASRHTDFIG